MTWFVPTVAFLHMIVYGGIMWWGWKSYRMWRKRSGLYILIGFAFLLLNRVGLFYLMMANGGAGDAKGTISAFIGGVVLLVAFWKTSEENDDLIQKLGSRPARASAGAQPVEFWENLFRKIVSEEIAKSKQAE